MPRYPLAAIIVVLSSSLAPWGEPLYLDVSGEDSGFLKERRYRAHEAVAAAYPESSVGTSRHICLDIRASDPPLAARNTLAEDHAVVPPGQGLEFVAERRRVGGRSRVIAQQRPGARQRVEVAGDRNGGGDANPAGEKHDIPVMS